MARSTRTRTVSLAVVGGFALVAGVLAGCGGDEFHDRTAVVDVGGRTTTFEVTTCGLDGITAFVVGRSESGEVLQAVVGVEEDDPEAGVPALTGLTVTEGDGELVAFGADAWALRGEVAPAPGSVTDARIRGARIQADGRFSVVDGDGGVTADGPTFRFDARCDEP